jgi:hypothetical protein
MTWHEHANCAGRDPTLFDPPADTEDHQERRRRVTRARSICAACAVAPECLIDAVRHHDSGIRAGFVLTQAGRPRRQHP